MDKSSYRVLEKYPQIDYAIVDRGEHLQMDRFVVAYAVDDKDKNDINWCAGHYFDKLLDAADYVQSLIKEHNVNLECAAYKLEVVNDKDLYFTLEKTDDKHIDYSIYNEEYRYIDSGQIYFPSQEFDDAIKAIVSVHPGVIPLGDPESVDFNELTQKINEHKNDIEEMPVIDDYDAADNYYDDYDSSADGWDLGDGDLEP